MCFVVAFSVRKCIEVQSWKDTWISNWEQTAIDRMKSGDIYCSTHAQEFNCTLRLPRYLPPRVVSNYTQLIPKIIWQTWKSTTAGGPHHFQAVTSFIEANPEYEYYLFDDSAALEFMCTFHSDQALIYQQVVPGAVKADLWRLAIIRRYGGVYFDTDSQSVTPLREFVWPNASVVSGMGVLNDFHQWALLYTPNHPIIRDAYRIAVHRLHQLHQSKRGSDMTKITGPDALHTAVNNILNLFNCSLQSDFHSRSKDTGGIVHFLPNHYCHQQIGVLQIYSGDFLGDNVQFKSIKADKEKNSASLYYRSIEHNYQQLFQFVPVRRISREHAVIGQCFI